MGLLDKAAAPEPTETPALAAKVEPTPRTRRDRREASDDEHAPRARRERARRERAPRERRAREPREPRDRPDRGLPAGTELASGPARYARGLCDFIVTWSVLLVAIGLGAVVDSGLITTWLLISGVAIAIINLLVLPIRFGMTLGNFVSRTRWVRWTGRNPMFIYHFARASTVPLWLFAFGSLVTSLVIELFGIDPDSSAGWPMRWVFMLIFLLPIIGNYVVRKIRHETMQDMWDSFLGPGPVYQVKYVASGATTGWMARLESLGSYAEARIARAEAHVDEDVPEVGDADDAEPMAA